jgi:nicotinate-nucleotide adenylyltransferase
VVRDGKTVVGVLGGTFDPVHYGHLGIARCLLKSSSLSRLWLLPSSLPPHKQARRVTAARHRLAMLRLAIENRPGLEICTSEIDREEVGYTIDTLRRLRDAPNPVVPVFVMGMDSLLELPTWKEFRSLIHEFDLVAVDRPGSEISPDRLHPEVARIVTDLPVGEKPAWKGGRIYRLRIRPIPISSSEIRTLVGRGDDPSGLVPPGVARYILDNRLYLEEELR